MDSEEKSVFVLLEKEAFRQWVWNPNPERDNFWKNWGGGNSPRIEAMELARLILLSIDLQDCEGKKKDYQSLFNRIKHSIHLYDVESFGEIPNGKETGLNNKKKK